MTENKRFSMTETELIFMVLDNGKALSRKEIVDRLNELYDENKQIKHTIQEAYNHERTALGKSILKQLLNNIGEI